MKIQEIRQKDPADLQKAVDLLKRELLNLRIQASMGQVQNPSRVRTARRTIARLKTVQNQLKQKGL
jgi:large subunit ribosomal protein L29